MIISHFNKKVDATVPVLISFIACTVVVGLITLRLFMTRNVIIEKNNKLIMKGIFNNTVINLDKVEYIKYFQQIEKFDLI